MDMKSLTFKTNINCSACVARVTPSLNELAGVNNWTVDINNSNKILEVKTDTLIESDIIQKLSTAGFKAEKYV
jgi:copper chaperone